MINIPVLVSTLKRPRIFLSIIGAVLVVLIWMLAYFLPQGSKISSLKTQETTLEQKVQQGNTTVAGLKHTYQHSAQLKTMQNKLNAAVPTTADSYNYVQALSATASSSGVHLTSISITSTAKGSTSSGSGSGTVAAVTQIPVSMTVKGTYDQILSLISGIYSLPRLTDINAMNISGGGAKTTRSSDLNVVLTLVAFSLNRPAGATS